MTERVTPKEFHEASGVEDWRVLGEGACAYFRTGSFATGARLVAAIGELPGLDDLNAVVAVRSGVAWAVGSTLVGEKYRALLARWDGHAWHPRSEGLGALMSVTGVSPRSVWATGFRPGRGYHHRAVIYRWNGERWARAFVSAFHATLNDIVRAGPGDLWAVGEREGGLHEFSRPLVVRRDASGWGVSPAPDVIGEFAAIAGTPNNLWTTRNYNTQGGPAGQYDTYHRC